MENQVNLSEMTLEQLVEREQSKAEYGYYVRLLGLVMDHGSEGLGLSRLDVAGMLRVLPDVVFERCAETHGLKDQFEVRIAVHQHENEVYAIAYHTHPDHAEPCRIGMLRLTIAETEIIQQ